MDNWFARHQVAVFLVLAFALSWWVWPFTLANPDSTAMVSFGPLVAAVVVSALAGGRSQLLDLLRSLVRWRVHWMWYLVALVWPFILAAVTAGLVIGSGVVDASNLGDDLTMSTWLGVPLLVLSTALLGGPLFEEPGWRGFLLPKLQRSHSALWATVVVGSVWALWHLPLLISEPTGQRPPLPFIVWILAQAVLYTWVYNGTAGSVLLVILLHGAVNSATRILLEPYLGDDSFMSIWWTVAGFYVLAAGGVTWWTRGQLGHSAARAPEGLLGTNGAPDGRPAVNGIGIAGGSQPPGKDEPRGSTETGPR